MDVSQPGCPAKTWPLIRKNLLSPPKAPANTPCAQQQCQGCRGSAWQQLCWHIARCFHSIFSPPDISEAQKGRQARFGTCEKGTGAGREPGLCQEQGEWELFHFFPFPKALLVLPQPHICHSGSLLPPHIPLGIISQCLSPLCSHSLGSIHLIPCTTAGKMPHPYVEWDPAWLCFGVPSITQPQNGLCLKGP